MKDYSINKIIMPTALPLTDTAVASWSELLSHNFRAKLMLYNAVRSEEDTNTAKQGNKVSDMIKTAVGVLRELGESLSTAHRVSYVVEVSNHWRNLIKQVRDEQADLLICGMPARGEVTPGRLTDLMYNSPCPVFFVREGMAPVAPTKILLPLRASDGFEQQLPAVIAWATAFKASIFMSTFIPDETPAREKLRLLQRAERIERKIREAGISLETETTHGYHFGTTMMKRAKHSGADMMAVCVKPTHYLTRLFTKMVGPFFLENAPIPVLSLPLIQAETDAVSAVVPHATQFMETQTTDTAAMTAV